MEIFRLFGSILIDSKEAESSIQKTESRAEKLVTSFGKGIKTAAKLGTTLVAGAAAAGAAAVNALNNVEESTREFRENQAKLQTAYEASGASAKAAQEAHRGLYQVLGDDDTATEAAQLLAQIATNSQSVGMWTDIAAGVVGTFGDALPINSLIEAANETAKVGTVTGALADSLSWAGISEDEFNAKLGELSSEEERNRLITYTLSRTYDDATEAFKANNAEAMANRETQLKSTETMARLGGVVSTVKTKLSNEFSPSINEATNAFIDLITGTEGADEALQESISSMINTAVENLPEFLSFGVDVIGNISTGIVRSIPSLVEKAPEIGKALIEALLDLGSELWAAGKELFSYFWDGFASFADSQSRTRADLSASDGRLAASGYSHAAGLAYVPYDNYPINAHRGEILLNSTDAGTLLDGMRALGKRSGLTRSALPQTFNFSVNLDGQVLARKSYSYNKRESDLRGDSLVEV